MRTTINELLLFISATTLLMACSKDKSDGENLVVNEAILGTWNFVGSSGVSRQIVTAGSGQDEEKIITDYAFVSQNNSGTVIIDRNKFTTSNMTYSVDTSYHTEMYLGGDLIAEFDMDWAFVAPASSGSSNYSAIGTDSLYFSSGFITMDPSAGQGSGPIATTPSGARISWSGDTLILKTTLVETKNQVVNGVNAKVSNNILQIVKLKK